MKFRRFAAALLAVALGASTLAEAKSPEEVRAQCRAEGRPCVGLVLSGGGARGFAHTGVLEVLEELGVKVDVVTGTSMGAMVGGAYAAGYSAAQIRDIVLGVDWDRMMAPRADRRDLPWRLKVDDYKNLSANGIEFTKEGQVKLPDSVVPSEELDLFLNDKTGPVNYVNDLTELAIPYGAIGTDLVTGERVVLQKDVNLGRAMRASMSLPGVFAPVVIHDRLLVDGGLLDNLPVKLARDMGADVIIAVNVGTPLLKREQLGNVVTVMAQMVNLLTEQNVRVSLKDLGPEDILITPDLSNFSSADLKHSKEIIAIGRAAADKARDDLARFAVSRTDWEAWDKTRKRAVMPETRRTEHHLSDIRVEGLQVANPEAILNEIDLDTSRPVSNDEIDNASRMVWADGDYSSVRYRFEPGPDGMEVLVFEPKEKKPGYSSIRIGGSLETDFRDEHAFNVLLSHTWGWLNPWGGELTTEIQAGENRRVSSEFYQPLGPGSKWFVNPKIDYQVQPFNLYEGGNAVARFRNETLTGHLGMGYTIGRLGFVRGAAGYAWQKSNLEIGKSIPEVADVESPFLSAELLLDTLDSVNFPTSGFRVNVEAQRLFDKAEGTGYRNIYQAGFMVPVSYGRWTTLFTGKVGKAALPGVFSLGGTFELTGSPYGRWTGSDVQLATVRVSRNVSDILGNSSQPIWVGASFESGRAWNRNDDTEAGDDRWHRAFGGYIGIDSLIGPIYLMTGRTTDEGWGCYFFWGRKM